MIETLQHDEPVATPVRSFGKQARSMAGYTLVTALMYWWGLFFVIPALVLHCGVRMGRRAAALLVVGSAILAMLLLYPAATAASAAEASVTYGYLLGLFLTVGVPALAVLPMVERGEKFGRVLLYTLLLSVVGLFVTELTMRMVSGFSLYAAQVAEVHAQTTVLAGNLVKAGFPVERVHFLQKWTDLSVPGSALTSIAIAFVFSLVMLGRLRAWREFILRRTPEAALANPYRFRNLSLPEWLLFAFVVSGLSPLASGMTQQIGANVLAVVSFLYLLQGLAIFRSFVAATGVGPMGSLFAWMLLASWPHARRDLAAAALHGGAVRLVFRFPTFQSKGSL